MIQYNFMVKPASSACDLKCKYCFYNDVSEKREVKSHGNMGKLTRRKLIERLTSLNDNCIINVAFQGGEPTLAGLSFFEEFVFEMNEKKKENQSINYSIQTNGFTLSDAWVSFFKDNNFLVGVSIDGFKENHDLFRFSNLNKPTHRQIMEGINLLRNKEVEFNVLTVLTQQLAKYPKKLYEFYKENKLNYVQLIPCLPPLGEEKDLFSLTPELFSSFYKELFDLWISDLYKGEAIDIRLFSDLIPMFRGIAPSQCGMLGYCSPQFVVESDGSVYPCDFYVLDDYKLGNIHTDEIKDLAKASLLKKFIQEPKRTTKLCTDCKFKSFCNGNCKRTNVTLFNEDYCGYQDFLEHTFESMKEISKRI